MKAYKLTDAEGQTRNATQWGENVTHETSGEGALCGPGWLHFYDDPYLAVLLNSVHGAFTPTTMQLWEGTAAGELKTDKGLKWGCTRLTTLRRMNVPNLSTEDHIEFAIRCAMQVCTVPAWVKWAENWMSGANRTSNAAADAAAYADAAAVAYAATAATSYATTAAATYAARAAIAAARAASAAYAASNAAATYAAYTATDAATAAARSATHAAAYAATAAAYVAADDMLYRALRQCSFYKEPQT